MGRLVLDRERLSGVCCLALDLERPSFLLGPVDVEDLDFLVPSIVICLFHFIVSEGVGFISEALVPPPFSISQ